MTMAVVVATCRPERMEAWLRAWGDLLVRHDARLLVVYDGDEPLLTYSPRAYSQVDVYGEKAPLFSTRHTVAVANMAYAWIAQHAPDVEMIVKLDDDVTPVGDTLADHRDALSQEVRAYWLSTTAPDWPPRGLPCALMPVWASHGVWEGVPDLAADEQLRWEAAGRPPVGFYRGPIPHGVLAPLSGMNFAFRREALPWMYYGPTVDLPGAERWDDIWCGMHLLRESWRQGKTVVTGYATVEHNRASDPVQNWEREKLGMELHEGYWRGEDEHPWFREYDEKREEWTRWIGSVL